MVALKWEIFSNNTMVKHMQLLNGKSSLVFSLLCAGIIGSFIPLNAATSSNSSTSSQQGNEEENLDLFSRDKSVFFVNAEFLYWIVNEGAVDYAIKMDHQPWSQTQDTYAVGDYHNAHFNWSPGFRVNFGYFRAPHYWDVFLQYTYLHAFGEREVHAPHSSTEFLNGTWVQPDVFSTFPAALERAKNTIDLQYNVLDFLFSRRFEPNEHLRINLFGGLTSALIFQRMKTYYKDVEDGHTHINNRWRFEGVGFRFGMKIDWYMGWDIYLTGTASAAALSGWYKNSAYQEISSTIPGVNDEIPIRNADFHDNRLTYTTQFLVGPSWQKAFENNRVELFAGYEMTIWTNLHQIYRSGFAAPSASKDTYINNSQVSLQGLTVRLNVDF